MTIDEILKVESIFGSIEHFFREQNILLKYWTVIKWVIVEIFNQ